VADIFQRLRITNNASTGTESDICYDHGLKWDELRKLKIAKIVAH